MCGNQLQNVDALLLMCNMEKTMELNVQLGNMWSLINCSVTLLPCINF